MRVRVFVVFVDFSLLWKSKSYAIAHSFVLSNLFHRWEIDFNCEITNADSVRSYFCVFLRRWRSWNDFWSLLTHNGISAENKRMILSIGSQYVLFTHSFGMCTSFIGIMIKYTWMFWIHTEHGVLMNMCMCQAFTLFAINVYFVVIHLNQQMMTVSLNRQTQKFPWRLNIIFKFKYYLHIRSRVIRIICHHFISMQTVQVLFVKGSPEKWKNTTISVEFRLNEFQIIKHFTSFFFLRNHLRNEFLNEKTVSTLYW